MIFAPLQPLSPFRRRAAHVALLASIDLADPDSIDSFSRASVAGYTGSGETAFQREAAVDVLRDAHYVSGVACVLLEDAPTQCALVAPENIVVTPDVTPGAFNFSFDEISVTSSRLRYEWRLDGSGSWTSLGTSLSGSGTTAPGIHVLNVRAVSTGGVFGAVATSDSFAVIGGEISTSLADLTGTQGGNGWQAGYLTTNADPSTFSTASMTWNGTTTWNGPGDFGTPILSSNFAHPWYPDAKSAAFVYTAAVPAVVNITLTAQMQDAGATTCRVWHNTSSVGSVALTLTNQTTNWSVTLGSGDTITLEIDPGVSAAGDATGIGEFSIIT